jgi:hypothetical protein
LSGVVSTLCRASYYISLLGLKIPLGLLARASHARYILAGLSFVVVPLNIYTHLVLLDAVREASYGLAIWHTLMAVWVTIPLLVVGSVILGHVRDREPIFAFVATLSLVACIHRYLIPLIQPTKVGSWLLQFMFAFFEDGSIAGWIWCLYYVVQVQDHVRSLGSSHKCPIETSKGSEDRILIVGNAPTVTDGAPLGAEIDNFADVVRFNQYTVHNPPYTGSKASYHFCNGRNLPEKAVKAVLPIFNASLTHAAYLFMPHMEDARETCETLMCCKASVWFVEEERLLALRKKIGCNLWQIPSSGMVAIDSFLAEHPKITLHGFNFFTGKQIHYFQESPTQLITSWLERFVTHNPPMEKRWVEGLMKEGRAAFLADEVQKRSGENSEHPSIAEDKAVAETMQQQEDTAEAKKLGGEDGEARRRAPGVMRKLWRDGMPSQFSI